MENNEPLAHISALREKTNGHEKRIEHLESQSQETVRISTLMELQIETNKEQNQQMKEFSNTMKNIDGNLTRLNENQEQLSNRVTDIEETLSESKVDINKIIKILFLKMVLPIAVAYLILKFGLK
ncbi:hypothetical protein V1503_18795 [Bacillus sp. SCS-151]|uniref:hypothetical protein n=1 Tax=Nanhaiella sioensis TaxID=3115293 RepID=UPI00397CD936